MTIRYPNYDYLAFDDAIVMASAIDQVVDLSASLGGPAVQIHLRSGHTITAHGLTLAQVRAEIAKLANQPQEA